MLLSSTRRREVERERLRCGPDLGPALMRRNSAVSAATCSARSSCKPELVTGVTGAVDADAIEA